MVSTPSGPSSSAPIPLSPRSCGLVTRGGQHPSSAWVRGRYGAAFPRCRHDALNTEHAPSVADGARKPPFSGPADPLAAIDLGNAGPFLASGTTPRLGNAGPNIAEPLPTHCRAPSPCQPRRKALRHRVRSHGTGVLPGVRRSELLFGQTERPTERQKWRSASTSDLFRRSRPGLGPGLPSPHLPAFFLSQGAPHGVGACGEGSAFETSQDAVRATCGRGEGRACRP